MERDTPPKREESIAGRLRLLTAADAVSCNDYVDCEKIPLGRRHLNIHRCSQSLQSSVPSLSKPRPTCPCSRAKVHAAYFQCTREKAGRDCLE